MKLSVVPVMLHALSIYTGTDQGSFIIKKWKQGSITQSNKLSKRN